MNGRISALLSILIVWLLIGACGGPVTEEDLQRWSNNDKGLERITELVADPKHPIDTRVRALEVVVEKSFVQRLVGMIDGLQEDREEILAGLVERMKGRLDSAEADVAPERIHLDAKDALLLLTRYVTPEEVDKIQEAIGQWAFKGITHELSEDEVAEKIEQRLSGGQIKNLGRHAYKGSSILIANKLEVDQMLELLSSADDKRKGYAAQLAVDGLTKLHKQLPVQQHHIAALGKLPSEDAAKYLLKVYRAPHDNPNISKFAVNELDDMICPRACTDKADTKDAESCSACCAKQKTTKSAYERRFCQCQWDGQSTEYSACLTHENIKNAAEGLSENLLEAMKNPTEPQDVMSIAAWRLQLLGADGLQKSLDLFSDNAESYQEEFGSWVGNFCDGIYRDNFSKDVIPVFLENLKSKNWAVQATSVICLKSARAYKAKGALRIFAKKSFKGTKTYDLIRSGKYEDVVKKALETLKKKPKTDKAELLPVGKSDVSLVGVMPEDGFNGPMTVGKLALNAVVGLGLMKKYTDAFDAKKFDKKEFGNRMDLVNLNTSAVDEASYEAFIKDSLERIKKAEEAAKKKAEAQDKPSEKADEKKPSEKKATDPPPAEKTAK